MRSLKFLAALAVALVAHLVGARLWADFPRVVDVFLVVVVLYALDGESLPAMLGGLTAGLVHDALSGGLYGLYGFADTLIGYGTARLAQRLVIQRSTGVLGVVAFATAAQQAALVVLAFLLQHDPGVPEAGWVAVRAGVCGVLGMAAHVAVRRWRKVLEARRRGRARKLRI